MFSSLRTTWRTPDALFRDLDAEFHFTLDVCADPSNAKCRRYFSEVDEAFWQTWAPERCWMNPPYGRGIAKWIQRAAAEAHSGALVVALLPARTDTIWWHNYVLVHADEVRYIRGRLSFDDARRKRATFPSVVVVWRPKGSCGNELGFNSGRRCTLRRGHDGWHSDAGSLSAKQTPPLRGEPADAV